MKFAHSCLNGVLFFVFQKDNSFRERVEADKDRARGLRGCVLQQPRSAHHLQSPLCLWQRRPCLEVIGHVGERWQTRPARQCTTNIDYARPAPRDFHREHPQHDLQSSSSTRRLQAPSTRNRVHVGSHQGTVQCLQVTPRSPEE